MPKAFKFRLEKLLDLRRLKEDVARRDHALARKDVAEQGQKLARVTGEREAEIRTLRELKRRTLDIVRLRLQEGYVNSLERRALRDAERLRELERKEAVKRQELAEASKGVRVLERLRERQFRAWAYQAGQEEQRFLDEVAQNIAREVS